MVTLSHEAGSLNEVRFSCIPTGSRQTANGPNAASSLHSDARSGSVIAC